MRPDDNSFDAEGDVVMSMGAGRSGGMTGRDLLLATLKHEQGLAVPWVPFAGVHAGKLRGYTGQEVLTEAGKLAEALRAVQETYDPDGMPVVFDLQVEAEILGCELRWAE